MAWKILRGKYLTINCVVNGEDEEQSYGVEECDPLGNKVKLFEFCFQPGGTTWWIAGTCQHCPLPWPPPCHDLIVVDTCAQHFRSISTRSYIADIGEERCAPGENRRILPVDHDQEKNRNEGLLRTRRTEGRLVGREGRMPGGTSIVTR
jgi:hypothetical protein